jgi:hypothetical protein
MVNKGNHPQMAQFFWLVKYYNLSRCIYIYTYWPHLLHVYMKQVV